MFSILSRYPIYWLVVLLHWTDRTKSPCDSDVIQPRRPPIPSREEEHPLAVNILVGMPQTNHRRKNESNRACGIWTLVPTTHL